MSLGVFLNKIMMEVPFYMEKVHPNKFVHDYGFKVIESKKCFFDDSSYGELSFSSWRKSDEENYYLVDSLGSGYMPSCAVNTRINNYISVSNQCFLTGYNVKDSSFKYVNVIMETKKDRMTVLLLIMDDSYLLLYEDQNTGRYITYDKCLLYNALRLEYKKSINYIIDNIEITPSISSMICNFNDAKSDLIDIQSNKLKNELITFTQKDDFRMVKLLLDKGTNPNVQNNENKSPLLVATSNLNKDIIKILLEKGADPNHQAILTPLMQASISGDNQAVILLLEYGAVPNYNINERTALRYAYEYRRDETIKILEDYMKGSSLLILASRFGYVDIVHYLIKRGHNPNTTNQKNETPLMLPSQKGYIDVVRLLLEQGADPNISNNEGWTALSVASTRGHLEVAKLLIEYGANINYTDTVGFSSLMYASKVGYIDLVRLYLEKGANPNFINIHGNTALSLAANNRHKEIIRLLVENGADLFEPKFYLNFGPTETLWKIIKLNFPSNLREIESIIREAHKKYCLKESVKAKDAIKEMKEQLNVYLPDELNEYINPFSDAYICLNIDDFFQD